MEVDIIFALAIAAAVVTFIVQGARVLRTMSLHKTLRKAVESGQPVTAELVEKLEQPASPGSQDQRAGFVLIALSIALLLAGWIGGVSPDNMRAMAGGAMFPLMVGAALLLRLRLNRNSEPA